MLMNSESPRTRSLALFDKGQDRKVPPLAPLDGPNGFGAPAQSIDMLSPTVSVTPARAVARRGMEWRGMGAEFVQATSHDRVEYSFRSPMHLLAAYEHGVRRDGESYVEGLSCSTLRDGANKLTFAPAGHEYREWHDPRPLAGVTYFYLDPAELQAEFDEAVSEFAPRLFFEDPTIWSTAAKLKHAIQSPRAESRLYFETLGVVLVHELMRLNRGAPRAQVQIRGGLAAWQERVVAAYIEENLPEQIPLPTPPQLGGVSTASF